MDDKDNLAYRELSLDELIGHLASDVQRDSQYNHIRFPPTGPHPTQRFEPNYTNENCDPAFLQRRNVYFQDNYQNHQRETMPFIINSHREEVMPNMIDMRGGDYVIFGPSHAQKNQNDHNLNFINKTNGTLSGFNDYGVEYTGPNYNLFSGISAQRHHSVPQFSHNAGVKNILQFWNFKIPN